MPLDTAPPQNSRWSAVRAALVADVLRGAVHPPSGKSLRVRGQIHGESMLPALWPGDVVEIESCPVDEIRPGEIVLALRDDRLVLHRLVGTCAPGGFLLRGDCVRSADPEYPTEALLGRLVPNARRRRAFTASLWFRAVGALLCHWSLARRLALKLHNRRSSSACEFRSLESW
ncbi:MAG: S24/S26 family peptidase [Terriglobales bacterium]